ncbi:MAG: hypothetical protein LRY40_06505 [Shewanella fodinae]|nr:hypothetical protein [Shewanella fodinae]
MSELSTTALDGVKSETLVIREALAILDARYQNQQHCIEFSPRQHSSEITCGFV